ncbi:hypothetical protein QE152_g37544 [Popillia japonica]|uniref:Fibronectin type-III domain-containing protein n=1 Tax=Popillia japonica TaxID=7064 RepID=A0AAW1I9K6_POPJA
MTQKERKIALGVAIGFAVILIITGVVILVLLLPKDSVCDEPARLPPSVDVYEIGGNVRMQWSYTGSTCNGGYLLRYSINGGQSVEISTKENSYLVINPSVCADILIQLRTVGESGRISEESVDRRYTVLPSNSHFTNGAVTRTPAGIVASWVKPAELEHCDISYIVKFDSEFTEVEEQITAQSIIVPEDLFCLSIRVQVASVVGFSQTNFATVGYGYAEIIEVNLSIPPENPFTLIATWSYHNGDICSLIYEVTYVIGAQRQTFVVSESRATFDIQYCVYALITIVPSFDGEYAGSQNSKSAGQEPHNVVFPPLENVQFVINGLSMSVSWDLPDALSWCEDLYEVQARNNYLGEEESCRGSSGCVVTLTNFCPSTDFIITPIGLKGDNFQQTISC